MFHSVGFVGISWNVFFFRWICRNQIWTVALNAGVTWAVEPGGAARCSFRGTFLTLRVQKPQGLTSLGIYVFLVHLNSKGYSLLSSGTYSQCCNFHCHWSYLQLCGLSKWLDLAKICYLKCKAHFCSQAALGCKTGMVALRRGGA